MSDTPAAANVLRKVLSGLTDHACRLEWRSDNPMRLTDTYKEGEGHHTWTEWEIEQFWATYPLGHRCGRSDNHRPPQGAAVRPLSCEGQQSQPYTMAKSKEICPTYSERCSARELALKFNSL